VEYVEVEGNTVEEAIAKGLDKLDVERDGVRVKVVEEGSKGLFGFIGQRPARVRVEKRQTKGEAANEFLESLIDKIGIAASVEKTAEVDNRVEFNLSGDNLGLIIGYHGQTLNVVQYLTNVAVATVSDEHKRIVVDAEGYRERRKRTLRRLAQRIARKVLRMGRPVELEPMVAHERKIIHTALADNTRVETHSEGNDPNRRVIIEPRG
jgi:spoIIIJ-associated protein